MQNIKLAELIDVKILQKLQDILSEYLGVAALITDDKGVPITEGSNFTAFCHELVRRSELGFLRCNECDRNGALDALRNRDISVYVCHAGLVDFSSPIMLENQMIGCLVGGQVRIKDVDVRTATETAKTLGIDPKQYIEEATKVNVKEFSDIERAARFISDIAGIISELAYMSFDDRKSIIKLESAARSQSDYMVDMYNNIKQVMGDLTANAEAGDNLFSDRLYEGGRELLNQAYNTVELSRMSTGGMNLTETAYNIRDLIGAICTELADNNNAVEIDIADDVPQLYYGDDNRIRKVFQWFIQESNMNTNGGHINIDITNEKHGYGNVMHFTLSDNGKGMTKEWLDECRADLNNIGRYLISDADVGDKEFRAVGVVIKQLSAEIGIDSTLGEGTTVRISIPQLEVNTL